MDCPDSYNADIDGVISLLKDEKVLTIKQFAGSMGEGFYKATYDGEDFFLNDKIVSFSELKELLTNLDNCLITEYLFAHSNITKIYHGSPNTIRITLIHDDTDGLKLLAHLSSLGLLIQE